MNCDDARGDTVEGIPGCLLMRGDCLDRMREIPDGSVDMVLADPPYGVTGCAWDSVIPFEPMWNELLRAAKPDAAIVLFSQMPFGAALIMSRRELFRYELIYRKPGPTLFLQAKKKPLRVHENILVFYRSLPTYNPQFTYADPYYKKRGNGTMEIYGGSACAQVTTCSADGRRYPVSVISFNNRGNNHFTHSHCGIHRTQKPVDLCAWLLRTYTNKGGTALDFCMGSGSTGVACMNEGRRFIGIEKDGAIFDAARERLADAARRAEHRADADAAQLALF